MVLYWPTPGFRGRTFKLCVLTRWDFNFCVRGSPLQGNGNNIRCCCSSVCTCVVVVKPSPHYYLPLHGIGRWGTTDDFTTSFLHVPLFSTALSSGTWLSITWCCSLCKFTFTWWGCYGLCLRHKPTEHAHSFILFLCLFLSLWPFRLHSIP